MQQHELGSNNLPSGNVAVDSSPQPLGVDITLITDSVTKAHQRAASRALSINGKETELLINIVR